MVPFLKCQAFKPVFHLCFSFVADLVNKYTKKHFKKLSSLTKANLKIVQLLKSEKLKLCLHGALKLVFMIVLLSIFSFWQYFLVQLR
jgi:hypothetical protein